MMGEELSKDEKRLQDQKRQREYELEWTKAHYPGWEPDKPKPISNREALRQVAEITENLEQYPTVEFIGTVNKRYQFTLVPVSNPHMNFECWPRHGLEDLEPGTKVKIAGMLQGATPFSAMVMVDKLALECKTCIDWDKSVTFCNKCHNAGFIQVIEKDER